MKDIKKITFIAGYYEPDICADTHLNSSLCNGLANRGYKVTVIAPFPSRGVSDEIIVRYSAISEETNSFGVRIIRVGHGKFKENIIKRGIGFLRKTVLLCQTAKRIETDCYILMSTPPFLGLIGKFLPGNTPKIYRLQDIFPDSLINAGIITETSLFHKFLKRLEKRIYSANDIIIAVSHDMRKQLLSRGVEPQKVDVVYNWIDENSCIPIKKENNILFDEFNLAKNKFYVVYAGNIGALQNVETIVKAAEYLHEQKDIEFIIIGDGTMKVRIADLIQRKSLNNIKMFPMQPLEKVSHVYSLGDVGVVSLKPNVSKSALPSKTWSIMASERPVICEIDTFSELNDTLQINECGICVAPNDHVAMAEGILKIYKNKELAEKMGMNGRNYIIHYMTEKAGIEDFIKCVEKCSFGWGDKSV